MKSETKIIYIAILLCAIGLFGLHIVESYREWVKDYTLGNLESCMVFEKPDSLCAVFGKEISPGITEVIGSKKCPDAKETFQEAYESCIEYAKHNKGYSPFPLKELFTW